MASSSSSAPCIISPEYTTIVLQMAGFFAILLLSQNSRPWLLFSSPEQKSISYTPSSVVHTQHPRGAVSEIDKPLTRRFLESGTKQKAASLKNFFPFFLFLAPDNDYTVPGTQLNMRADRFRKRDRLTVLQSTLGDGYNSGGTNQIIEQRQNDFCSLRRLLTNNSGCVCLHLLERINRQIHFISPRG